MIVILTGTPGSGKTKTVEYLMESTPQSAAIDGDRLLAINPFNRTMEERKLQYKNIASLARNYFDAGYKTIFIAFVYGKSQLTMQVDLLKDIDKVAVFVLVPKEETLRSRHKNDSYIREAIDSSLELNKQMAEYENVEIIDNSEMTVEEVGSQIKQRIKSE